MPKLIQVWKELMFKECVCLSAAERSLSKVFNDPSVVGVLLK